MALLTQKVESDFTNKTTFINSMVQELQSLKLQIIQVRLICWSFCLWFSCITSHWINSFYMLTLNIWHSSSSKVNGCRLNSQDFIPDRGRYSLFAIMFWLVQTSSAAHLTSYQMCPPDFTHRAEVTGMWSWPLTSIYYRSLECIEMYLLSSSRPTSSWCGAYI